MLSAAEFKQQFFEESSDLKKIKLAIQEKHYSIWTRENPENFGPEFLTPILELPEDYPIERKSRESGGPGDPDVIILKYDYIEFGITTRIYLKGYFRYDGGLDVEFEIQSLKETTSSLKVISGGNKK
jgi:hypothetical protein